MRLAVNFLIGLVIAMVISCDKNHDDSVTYSFKGKAQKGPFVTGTIITCNELNSKLGQTGSSIATTIASDDGSFVLNNIQLNSNVVLLTANGFYFSEIYGELSSEPILLQSLSDLKDKEAVNINVLTHLTKGRIENLVNSGKSFVEANAQTKSEVLSFLGVTDVFEKDFDNLDISANADYDAVLLSFSIILQRYTLNLNERPALTAELTQLLSNLSIDFAPDGIISNRMLIDTLLYNISKLNLIDIRNNIQKRYSDLGQSVTIPDFEKYITIFQDKYSSNLYTEVTYPLVASPDPETAPDAKLQNILVPEDTLYQLGPYSVAAIVPSNKILKIKFIGSNFTIGNPIAGWSLINDYPNGFTLNSQKHNELMSMLLHLDSPGTTVIEYYEDNASTPTFSKTIRVPYTDSIPLKYVVCPRVRVIYPFVNDSIKIRVEEWTEYNGPNPYTASRITIESHNPSKIKVSYGKIQNGELVALKKESLIDESLDWHSSYISGGFIQGSIGLFSKYVGMKIILDDRTYYGWIHTPTPDIITEYAFDTCTVIDNRKIYAGRLKK